MTEMQRIENFAERVQQDALKEFGDEAYAQAMFSHAMVAGKKLLLNQDPWEDPVPDKKGSC